MARLVKFAATIIVLGTLFLYAAEPASANATLIYVGQNFQNVSGVYSTNMFVTGTIELFNPLPPRQIHYSPAVVHFSFSDGVQTISDADCCRMSFSTSSDGSIFEWYVLIRSETGEIQTFSISAGSQIAEKTSGRRV
jgi:hypothetical protein